MNWPNRLSLTRMACVPLLAALMTFDAQPWTRIAALAVFIAASITDFVDGWWARKYQIVTNFGKFIDPVADKLLVLSAMVLLGAKGLLPAWLTVLVLMRELAVDGLRLIASQRGQVIAAGKLGKIKTICQMVMVIAHLVLYAGLQLPLGLPGWLLLPSRIAVVVMTLWSGVDYFVRNREVLHD